MSIGSENLWVSKAKRVARSVVVALAATVAVTVAMPTGNAFARVGERSVERRRRQWREQGEEGVRSNEEWLTVFRFPAYAPDLNP
jgi:hypothetical protein